MILSTMTDEEIHEYLHKDFLTLDNTVFNRTGLLRSIYY